jgi:phage-related minor tail protein
MSSAVLTGIAVAAAVVGAIVLVLYFIGSWE